MEEPLAAVDVDAGRIDGRENVDWLGGMVAGDLGKLMFLFWYCCLMLMLELCVESAVANVYSGHV